MRGCTSEEYASKDSEGTYARARRLNAKRRQSGCAICGEIHGCSHNLAEYTGSSKTRTDRNSAKAHAACTCAEGSKDE